MTNLSRLYVTRRLAFSLPLLILPATSGAQQRPPIAGEVAKTYGLDSFGKIEGIRNTFTAEFPGVKLSRSGNGTRRPTGLSRGERQGR